MSIQTCRNMKVCVKCKATRDGKFCASCGTQLVEGKLCDGKSPDGTNCNEIIKTGEKYCSECGKDHSALQNTEEGKPLNKRCPKISTLVNT